MVYSPLWLVKVDLSIYLDKLYLTFLSFTCTESYSMKEHVE